MSSSDVAIAVRGLSKAYTIRKGANDHNTLAESMLARVRHPFRRASSERFFALNNVSFEIKAGESVGIIGRNGAGKSTLLKVLSRVTEPTAGEVDLYGRVGSLLEVGTGFHYELTGRENIFLNGAILGMRKAEILKRFDAIVDFAGVEKFLDTPVKRYSSGMFVRLAFAVASYLDPEILLVDEVLAVGDADFQRKCIKRMQDVTREGRTILFVSHNVGIVRSLCDRGIVLSAGSVVLDASADEATDRYLQGMAQSSAQAVSERHDRSGRGAIRFVAVRAHGESGIGSQMTIGSAAEVAFEISRWHPGLSCHFTIQDRHGLVVAHCTTVFPSPGDDFHLDATYGGPCEAVWATDELLLMPGQYHISAEIYCEGALEDRVEGITAFDVEAGSVRGRAISRSLKSESAAFPHRWYVRPLEVEHVAQRQH